MRRFLIVLTTWLMLAVTLPAFAFQAPASPDVAAGAPDEPEAPDLQVNQAGCTTLGQAVEQVRRQHNGRIVSAETRVSGGRETHIIKVLTSDGKVRTVRVPGCRV